MKPELSIIPEPDLTTEARNVSEARRRRIINGQNGICKRPFCGAPATDVDHIIPLWRFGTNLDGNLEALCGPCHSVKTKAEAKVRAKADAMGGKTGQYARRKTKGGSSIKSGKSFPTGRKIASRPSKKTLRTQGGESCERL